MKPHLLTVLILSSLAIPAGASASPLRSVPDEISRGLAPHKAVYDIKLVATHSGSQILNVSGSMSYEWKPSCDAWTTDHRFKLFYEYADSPGMRIASNFSTYETFDGRTFDFISRRMRDDEAYQTIRGHAELGEDGGKAVFAAPEGLTYDLSKGSLFPIAHTVELIRHAENKKRFYSAVIFDGSDEEGPVEINSFIGKRAEDAAKIDLQNKKIDRDLLKSPAWHVRMAVFPQKGDEAESDYEMDLVFHKNGVISDMRIEYDDFSVTQKLVSLEAADKPDCGR